MILTSFTRVLLLFIGGMVFILFLFYFYFLRWYMVLTLAFAWERTNLTIIENKTQNQNNELDNSLYLIDWWSVASVAMCKSGCVVTRSGGWRPLLGCTLPMVVSTLLNSIPFLFRIHFYAFRNKWKQIHSYETCSVCSYSTHRIE